MNDRDNTRPNQGPSPAFFKIGAAVLAVLTTMYVIFGSSHHDASPKTVGAVASSPNTPETAAPEERKVGRYVVKGTGIHLVSNSPACAKLEDLTKVIQLAQENDNDAIMRMLGSGACRALDDGTKGTAQDSALWQKAQCIRLRGTVDCLWVPVRFIQED